MESPKAFDKAGPLTKGLLLTEEEQGFIGRYHQLAAQDKPIVREFMAMSPSQIPLKLWDLGERGISKIETLKRTLGESSPAWKQTQSDLMHRLVKDPSRLFQAGEPGRLPVQNMTGGWARTVFTPEQSEFLSELQNYLRTSQVQERVAAAGTVKPTGQHTVIGVQVGALGNAIYQLGAGNLGAAAVSGGVALSPAVVAKLASSPRTNRLLIEALKERPGTIRGIQIAGQLQQAIRDQQKSEGKP
jgi:hypothetical protein